MPSSYLGHLKEKNASIFDDRLSDLDGLWDKPLLIASFGLFLSLLLEGFYLVC